MPFSYRLLCSLTAFGGLLLLAAPSAHAQWVTGKVVSSCGGQTLIPGNPWPFTIDTAGNPCPATQSASAPTLMSLVPSSSASVGIVPVSSTAAEASHILKASAGNLYSVIVTPSASGYLLVFNALSAPADGAVTPIFCVRLSANSSGGLSARGGIPAYFNTGIVVVYSTTGCFTKTASATAAFQAMVQ